MDQFEIEVKLPLKNLKETLKLLTDHDVKKRDEALRIRTSTDCRSGISKTQINFKGPKLDKVSMSRMELETEVSDTEVLKNILIHLDFQIFPLISCSVGYKTAKIPEMRQIYRLSGSGRGTWRLSGA